MLSNLADSASTTLGGADAQAASGAGVRDLLAAKARLQRRDARRCARVSNTVEEAVAACGAVPSPRALDALRVHATAVVVAFGAQIEGLPAPFGATHAEAAEAVLAIALVLALPRGLRLGDVQCLTYAALEPAPVPRGGARRRQGGTRRRACAIDFATACGKTADGARSGFEEGAADELAAELHRALCQIFGWLSPPCCIIYHASDTSSIDANTFATSPNA